MAGAHQAETDEFIFPHQALLSAEEEAALAQRIQKGGKIFDLVRRQECDYRCQHRQRLLDSIPDAVTARNELVQRNVGWIVNLAQQYVGYGFTNMVEEGIIAALRSAEKFEPAKGRFSTYLTRWATQGMIRFGPGYKIGLSAPLYTQPRIIRIGDYIDTQSQLGNSVTDQDLSQLFKIPMDEVSAIRRALGSVRSLDMPIPNSDGLTLLDIYNDQIRSDNPDDNSVVKVSTDVLEVLANKLGPKEKQVINLMYLNSTMSTASAAEKMGLSPQRVRQIRNAALAKLKALLAYKVFPKTD